MKKLKLSDLKINKLKIDECIYINGGLACPPPYFNHDWTEEGYDDYWESFLNTQVEEEISTIDNLIDKLPVTSDTIYC